MIICPHLTSVANVWLRNFCDNHTRVSALPTMCTTSAWAATPPQLHPSSTRPSCKVTPSDGGHAEHRTWKKSRCVVCLLNKHIQILNIQCIRKFSPLSGRKKLQWRQTEDEETVDLEFSFCIVWIEQYGGRAFLSSPPWGIYWPFWDQSKTNVPVWARETRRGGDVHTLNKPSTHRNPPNPHGNDPTTHEGEDRGKTLFLSNARIVGIHPHVQNTLSLRYTSGKKKKKTHKERQSKPCMHLVTPRGTQCDTLCIIASIF